MSASSSVEASHILVKHVGSRRQASWKDPEGIEIRKRSREDAVNELRRLLELLHVNDGSPEQQQQQFAKLATQHSDCGSAQKNGSLGRFGRRQMMKEFEDVAFALKVGEISDVVDTDSGSHIILRTA